MRFLARMMTGLAILAVTLGLIAYAGLRLNDAFEARQAAASKPSKARERSYIVTVETLRPTDARSIITAYGEVRSGRKLELRASTSGHLVEIAPEFREGARVESGDLLFRIDPAPLQSALDRAKIAQAEAEAALAEAHSDVALAEKELAASRAQAELRANALARQESLKKRGVGTEAAVESAKLALSAARQTEIGREQALANARARITRARISLDRAKIEVADAERELSQATVRAPFSGVLNDVGAVLGRRVNTNEKLGELIDLNQLEAAFRVSNSQFSRLLAQGEALARVEVTVRLDLEDAPIVASARLDRAGAEVGEGSTGRLIYAKLDPETRAILRPGDFVTIEIPEPMLENVAVIPATAATEDGRILIVDADDRLVEERVQVLRRQGDFLIVDDAPFGARLVTERLPQLGVGVKVKPTSRPESPERAEAREMAAAGGSAVGGGGVELIALEPDRRARLIAFVRGSDMGEDARDRLIAALSAPRAPRSVVERLESRMGG